MKNLLQVSAALLLWVSMDTAHAYGNDSSSKHCEKPMFTEFQPAANKYTQSFTEFSFTASANTTPSSIVVHVSAGNNKVDLDSKQLQITPLPGGRFEVKGKLNRPIEHGFVRVSATAHSKPGCDNTQGYLIRIQ